MMLIISLVILTVNLLPWIEQKISSGCYDSEIIQWVDKDKKIFKYIKKRTGSKDVEKSRLFIDWAIAGNTYGENIRFSVFKHNLRQALKSREKLGLVKELNKKHKEWYTWQILENSGKAVKTSDIKNNVSKKEKNRKVKTVDQQTQTIISKVPTKRGKRKSTGKLQSKTPEKKSMTKKNIPVQNDDVSSSTKPLPPCQSLLQNFPCTSTSLPATNLDHQLEVFSQQNLNQISHNINTVYVQTSNTEIIQEVPLFHPTNTISDLMIPDSPQLEESIYNPKYNEDISPLFEPGKLESQSQTLCSSLSYLENLSENELEQSCVLFTVQLDSVNTLPDDFLDYDVNLS
ncbi:uncharacterized protein [Parasteatoda tepidariorum]|uniref:uncharacterized protein n=1 Tax=Parasteatoda tepidariorum TaxID=114398 RepID=UPI001C719F42|nr:uncharacterized protein LOC107441261 [Parasteatoda tepidariorum]XP_042906683.1 uncharacterized protein LOC107441261 [Parasteatoda tepidariorum]